MPAAQRLPVPPCRTDVGGEAEALRARRRPAGGSGHHSPPPPPPASVGALAPVSSVAYPAYMLPLPPSLCLLPALQAERGRKRLAFLLKQAEVFQHFAPLQAAQSAEKKKKGGRHAAGTTEEQEDEELLRDEEGGAEAAGHRLQVDSTLAGWRAAALGGLVGGL